MPLRVYEKEKKQLDTVWLLPRPPDSAPGSVYVLVKGRGLLRVAGATQTDVAFMTLGYRTRPTFLATESPDAILTYDPSQTAAHRLYSCTVRAGRGWSADVCYVTAPIGLQELLAARIGNWSIAIVPKELPPGQYAYTGVGSIVEYLFEVGNASGEPGASPEEPPEGAVDIGD